MENREYNGMENYIHPAITIEKNYITFELGDSIGIADRNGKVIIPFKDYEWFIPGYEFFYIKEFEKEWELYDLRGETIERIEYDDIVYKEDEFVMFKVEGHWDLCDLTYLTDPDMDEEYED